MKTIDCPALLSLLKSDVRTAIAAFKAMRPGETFYAFALYTDSDAITVSAYGNTNEKAIGKSEYARWSPDEWAFLDNDNFMAASQRVVSDYDGFEEEAFEQRKSDVLGCFAAALRDLRIEGVFDQEIALFVTISDPSDEELNAMRHIIKECNSVQSAPHLLQSICGGA